MSKMTPLIIGREVVRTILLKKRTSISQPQGMMIFGVYPKSYQGLIAPRVAYPRWI